MEEVSITPAQAQRDVLSTMVRGAYAIQKLRIQTGNRLCAAFRVRLGIESGPRIKTRLQPS